MFSEKKFLEQDVDDKDQYGRLLRYVYVNGTFVNLEIVRLDLPISMNMAQIQNILHNLNRQRMKLKKEGCLWKSEEVNYIQDKCIQITTFNAAGDDNYNLNDEYVTWRINALLNWHG